MIRVTEDELEDDGEGKILTRRAHRKMTRLAAECLAGRVLEAGLGFGWSRRAMWRRANHFKKIRTIEKRQGVVDLWRQRRDEPDGPFDFSPENADTTVEVNDIRDVVRLESRRAVKRIDAMFFDLETDNVLADQTFQENLRLLFPKVGQRVVVRCDAETLVVPGFKVNKYDPPDLAGDTCIWLLDRWDPAAGIGIDPFAGRLRIPGAGWVPIEEVR
jgi:hypothetical protein